MLATDLLRLGLRGALSHALLLLGDGDFAPVVEAVRDLGVRVTILSPHRQSISSHLRSLADTTLAIPTEELAGILKARRPHLKAVDQAADQDQAAAQESTAPRPSAAPVTRQPGRLSRGVLRLRPSSSTPATAKPANPAGQQQAVQFVPFIDAARDRAGITIHSPQGTRTIYLCPSSENPDPATLELHVRDRGETSQDKPRQLIRPFEPGEPVA